MTDADTITFHTQDYQPGTNLDEELAALGYACIYGWPDQRPITASLVRSRLATHAPLDASDMSDSAFEGPRTILITARASDRQLAASIALRPHTSTSSGRLWGPIVHPDHQRNGLGRHLLNSMKPHLDRTPHLSLSTAEVPDSRTHAGAFLTSAGWAPATTLQLVKGALPPPHTQTRMDPIGERFDTGTLAHLEPKHQRGLGDLFKQCRPHASMSVADATYARWSSDERFTPDCTLIVEKAGRLLAAVLVYPLTPTTATTATTQTALPGGNDGSDGKGEPAEALIGDVLTDPSLPMREARELARPLLRTALACAAECHGARVARALIDRRDAIAVDALTVCGLTPGELFHCYQSGPDREGTR